MVELKKDFTRGQENAQDGLNANFKDIEENFNKAINDETFNSLTVTGTVATSTTLEVIRKGDMCYLQGNVKFAGATSWADREFCRLPEKYAAIPSNSLGNITFTVPGGDNGGAAIVRISGTKVSVMRSYGGNNETYWLNIMWPTSAPFE